MYFSNFITYELPPGLNEVSDNNIVLDNLVTGNVSIDIITRELQTKTSNVARFKEKSFLIRNRT